MSNFSQYVTAVAFRLELSSKQIAALGQLAAALEKSNGRRCETVYAWGDTDGAWGLARKGLAHPPSGAPRSGKWALTQEGELVVKLLKHAGLLEGAENTEDKFFYPRRVV